jgi:outer membrane protein assembly factor BamB
LTANLPAVVVRPGGLMSDSGNAAPAYDLIHDQVYVGNGLYAFAMDTGVQAWVSHTVDVTVK